MFVSFYFRMEPIDSLKNKDCYAVRQSQLISILRNAIASSLNDAITSSLDDTMNDALKNIISQKNPPFTEFECRRMKLPQLKYEVQIRKLRIVGTGKGGAAKKIDYINALLGRQIVGKVVRSLDHE